MQYPTEKGLAVAHGVQLHPEDCIV